MFNHDDKLTMMMGAVMVARGNPGCMTMLMEMQNRLSPMCYSMCQATLLEFDLIGADAYLLWNDVCDRKVNNMAELLYKLKVGAIPLHVIREDLAAHRLSKRILNAQLPYASWMDSFSLDSIAMFGRDVLAPLPGKEENNL